MRAKLKKRRMGPEPVSPTGQPHEGRVTTPSKGQEMQPGHPHLGSHPKTGTAKPDVSVTGLSKAAPTSSMSGVRPKTVKMRIHAPPSHHTIRTAGQVKHESGQKVVASPSHRPFDHPSRGYPQHAGRPQVAAQADVGGPRSMENLMQERIGKYGTKDRFKRLRMTPKSDGGHY